MTSATIIGHLTADHRRLKSLLDAAVRSEPFDLRCFAEFRSGLLRHIGMEEKILLPAAQAARDSVALPIAGRLRLDHGAIAALLVPTPTPVIVATLRHVLRCHNPIEEGPDGLYATCDRLLADGAASVVARLESYPAVHVSPHNDGPEVMPAVGRALERAGYQLSESGRGGASS
jgi:hypothetical protein